MDDALSSFKHVDAYTLADGAQRSGAGSVIHALRPQTSATTFVGRALTARIHYEPHQDIPVRDYGGWKVRERAGRGEVVVLDGGGLPYTAMGGLAALQLKRSGAAAAVVNACIRDAEEMDELGFPVFAMGTAITSLAGHAYLTDIGEPVSIQGVRVATGDLISGCRGGVVVVAWKHREQVLKESLRLLESDRLVREGLERGESVGALWLKHKDLSGKVPE